MYYSKCDLGDQKKPYIVVGGVKIQGIFEKVSVPMYIYYRSSVCDFMPATVQSLLDTVSGNTLS